MSVGEIEDLLEPKVTGRSRVLSVTLVESGRPDHHQGCLKERNELFD